MSSLMLMGWISTLFFVLLVFSFYFEPFRSSESVARDVATGLQQWLRLNAARLALPCKRKTPFLNDFRCFCIISGARAGSGKTKIRWAVNTFLSGFGVTCPTDPARRNAQSPYRSPQEYDLKSWMGPNRDPDQIRTKFGQLAQNGPGK